MIDIKKHLQKYRWYHFLCEVAVSIFLVAISIIFIEAANIVSCILCLMMGIGLFIYACVDFIDMGRVLHLVPGSSKHGHLLIEVDENR